MDFILKEHTILDMNQRYIEKHRIFTAYKINYQTYSYLLFKMTFSFSKCLFEWWK